MMAHVKRKREPCWRHGWTCWTVRRQSALPRLLIAPLDHLFVAEKGTASLFADKGAIGAALFFEIWNSGAVHRKGAELKAETLRAHSLQQPGNALQERGKRVKTGKGENSRLKEKMWNLKSFPLDIIKVCFFYYCSLWSARRYF